MKDLDFDELDKAVNSLMSGVPKDQASRPLEKTVTLPESTHPMPSGVSALQSPSPSTPLSRARPAPSSLATRRSGRFMDVVHPSADMKPKPSKAVSRQGATLAPSSEAAAPEEPVIPEPVSTPASEAVKDEAALSPHQPQVTSDWPDPLDMIVKKDEVDAGPVLPKANKFESTAELRPTDTAPLTSPFLPDAKVEKRPLGGSSNEPSTPELPVQSMGKEDLTVDDPDAQLPPTPIEPETPLPEELQGDLVAIESGSAKETPAGDKSEKEEKKTAASLEPEKDSGFGNQPGPTPEPSGPTSIPKQYKEEPSTSDQQSGAIYDTDTYHQPLAHPAKKKSGWLIVLWIVLIIALGAAIGAALFFLGVI